MKTIEEDLEEASGRRDREDWFEEGGCSETRQVEGRSASNCRRKGVNPASLLKDQHRIKTESLLLKYINPVFRN